MSESHEKHSPLDQFKIEKLFEINIAGVDLSITNSALYMIISTFIVIFFSFFSTKKLVLLPGKFQVFIEFIYNFVLNIISSTIGNKEGEKFFPLIFSIFIFIVLCNIIGLTPYSFTATSQIVVTLSVALVSFITVITFSIRRNGFNGFVRMFMPSGLPIAIAPLIFIIEFFSFLVKPITLSVRLFANMVAGHVLLKVVASFVVSLGIFGFLPLLFSSALVAFELFVAILQSYIFSILVCSYLSEVTKSH
jgi:F-type H+-transporting ATPase subunit a